MSASARHTLPQDLLPAGELLTDAFFARGAGEVADDLVGKIVWRRGFGGGRLAEVEAYLPVGDPASHAAPGETRRNAAMFGPPGRLYVFLSYGVHRLLNFVCDEEGVGSAVLVRSLEPLGDGPGSGASEGARGPGIVGRLLGVELGMSGLALGEESGLFVVDDGMRPDVGRTVRVGITRGVQLPLRHYMIGSRYVSGPPRMIGEK
jgi:DNA-3-methyladenine glycosylase